MYVCILRRSWRLVGTWQLSALTSEERKADSIDLTGPDPFQAEELRAYFKSLGDEISAERSPKGIEDDLHKIIGVCDAALQVRTDGQQQSAANVEEVLNGIVSMLATGDKSDNLILSFSEKLSKAPTENDIGLVCLKV